MDFWESLKRGLLAKKTAESKTEKPHSSVLALIGVNQQTGQEEILLMKRTMTVDSHKGQICFPGGYCEDTDVDTLATALRETFEELGVPPDKVQVLGSLNVTTTRNTVLIHPHVGRLDFPFQFTPSTAEVERVFFLPVERLINEGLKPVTVQVENFRVQSVGIEVEGELVWGATARMLEELREVLIELKKK